jgi:hypothetical protein
MNQFVNAALASIKQGDKNKATELLRQAIASDQNDIDAWLVLSALIDQPERKRQCLNRVLTLAPTHKIAREEMLKLDRAAMGNMSVAQPSRPIQERNIQPPPPLEKPVQSYYSEQLSTPQAPRAQAPSPQPVTPQRKVDKPLVFRYPILILLATYVFAILFFAFNIIAITDSSMFLGACGFSLLSLASIWVVSAKVEVSEEGIASSRVFGLIRAQVKWDEIVRVNSASLGNTLALVTQKGSSVKITSQVSGYPTIIKILREKRPDLFGMVSPVYSGSISNGYGSSTQQAAGFAGKKVFKKGILRRFGSYLITVPFLLVSVWTIFTDEEYFWGASIAAAFCIYLVVVPLFDIFKVVLEGGKITLISMMDEKELTARQINEVKMKSVRRRSVVHYFPTLVTEKRKEYSLQGFSEGAEILYGFLLNWWNTYRYQ